MINPFYSFRSAIQFRNLVFSTSLHSRRFSIRKLDFSMFKDLMPKRHIKQGRNKWSLNL